MINDELSTVLTLSRQTRPGCPVRLSDALLGSGPFCTAKLRGESVVGGGRIDVSPDVMIRVPSGLE